ncbi:hypothetical protein GOP47_0009175 [Adiantum capillus-veneris]|uniref:Uncharacterized protein n=1 Tax=Adiantum capillus-veneris TaxID=13818 RepID=A0A9D4ZGZ6_ADICA|nr:hypothetical protein GOP47_0031209 [Adiantum capillus-veneris]KAI5075099.1 hypothetical protein GOP47_0009175 [Adiantum capillus-veneris]
MLDSFQVAGSGGSVPGDSGGPVFLIASGKLVGINTSVSLVHPCLSIDDAAKAQTRPQALIKPFSIIELLLNAETGVPFFGSGGQKAIYNSSAMVTTSSRAAPVVKPQPQELLCTEQIVPRQSLADLLDPELLDLYIF